ncbi:hypothetical protein P691DRAFT_791765 [Macrolepiota fuliginosa MF-IS2]|uniref:Uncharacterized protein n=1 Tax=Macrolepiota fuliginosa MF-IS2 TaxID=1400762 RepID=A0A9P5WYA2_9AGAR|nr:hypothetical protein P691DRAFT_791765 [Macrolepiota fuliginosa MF-IS2]
MPKLTCHATILLSHSPMAAGGRWRTAAPGNAPAAPLPNLGPPLYLPEPSTKGLLKFIEECMAFAEQLGHAYALGSTLVRSTVLIVLPSRPSIARSLLQLAACSPSPALPKAKACTSWHIGILPRATCTEGSVGAQGAELSYSDAISSREPIRTSKDAINTGLDACWVTQWSVRCQGDFLCLSVLTFSPSYPPLAMPSNKHPTQHPHNGGARRGALIRAQEVLDGYQSLRGRSHDHEADDSCVSEIVAGYDAVNGGKPEVKGASNNFHRRRSYLKACATNNGEEAPPAANSSARMSTKRPAPTCVDPNPPRRKVAPASTPSCSARVASHSRDTVIHSTEYAPVSTFWNDPGSDKASTMPRNTPNSHRVSTMSHITYDYLNALIDSQTLAKTVRAFTIPPKASVSHKLHCVPWHYEANEVLKAQQFAPWTQRDNFSLPDPTIVGSGSGPGVVGLGVVGS